MNGNIVRRLAPYVVQRKYTIEYCPFCDSEAVIFQTGVTACPHCGKPLAPCSMCEGCDYASCPYGCDGTDADERKIVTNPLINPGDAEYLYQYL